MGFCLASVAGGGWSHLQCCCDSRRRKPKALHSDHVALLEMHAIAHYLTLEAETLLGWDMVELLTVQGR